MITIYLNKQSITLSTESKISDILNQHGFSDDYFSIAINQKFIPRSSYATTYLKNNDVIDILSPMQGG